ncbi:MAG: PKD domain-containing protein [Bacteroidetes bacterium]|nr:PKD domain-containing protein [Bacteroidota bacterium]
MCSEGTVNFQGPAGTGYTYLWNFGDPASGVNNTSTLQNPGHIFKTYGCGTTTYNVILTVTTSCGCSSASTPQVVSIKQQPKPRLADQDPFTPFSNCENNPTPANHNFGLTVNNTSTNSSCITGYTINWGDGGGNIPFPAGFTTASHTYTELGAFNLTVTATNSNGCSNDTTYVVANQSNPAVGISAAGSTSGCLPVTWPFTISGAANNSPGTIYRIEFGDGASIIKTNDELLIDSIVTHEYITSSCGQGLTGNQFIVKVTAINACDCTYTLFSNVKVYKPPVANFTSNPTNPGCVNSQVCFTNTTINGYGLNCIPTSVYSWNFGDPSSGVNNTSTATNPCHIYANPGNYTITLTAGNGPCPNASTYSKTICINPQPNSSFALNQDIGCKPLTINATNQSTTPNNCGDLAYTWSVVFNGSGTCTPSAGAWVFASGTDLHSQNATFIFNDPGSYSISLAVQNFCSTVTSTKTVTVKTVPKVTVAPITSFCSQGTVFPTATYELCYGNLPTFSWSFPGGNPTGSTLLIPGAVTYSSPATYTITLNASNECGTGTNSTNIIVKPLPVATALPVNQTVCSGQTSLPITLSSSITPGTTYSWTAISSPGITGAATSGTANPIPAWNLTNANTMAGTVTVTITPTANGCAGFPISHVITVVPRPVLTTIPSPNQEICSGTIANIILSSNIAGASFSWLASLTSGLASGFTSGSGSSISQMLINSSNSIPAIVTYSITPTANGCTGTTVNHPVTINPLPLVNAGADQTIAYGVSTTLNGQSLGGTAPLSYYWEPAARIASGQSTLTPQTTILTQTTTFTLHSTDSKNCTTSDNVIVFLNGNPLIVSCTATPNVFCGNGGLVQLSATVTGGSGNYSYLWSSNPSGWNSTIQNPLVTPDVTTTFTLVVNDGFSSASNTVQVTVNPIPFITTWPLSKNICSGSGTNITLSSIVTGATFQWTSSVTSGSITGNSASGICTGFINDILVNSGVTFGTVSYIITPIANGCQGPSVNFIVVVMPLPLIATSPASQTICSGASSQPITISSTLTETTYSWATISSSGITGATLSGTGNPVPGWVLNNSSSNPGTVIINITPSSLGCAGTTLSYQININPQPTPVITGAGNVCIGGGTLVYVTEPGMTEYQWNVSSGGTIVSGAGSNSIVVSWAIPGQYYVNVNYTNSSGCMATNPSILNVTVTGAPVAPGSIFGLSSVCVEASGVAYSVNPIQNVDTYSWTLPLGATLASGAGSNSITVNFPNFVTTGNIRVLGVNSCFTGPPSPNFQVKTNALLTGQVTLNNMVIGNGQQECLAVQNIIVGGNAPFTVEEGGEVRLIASENILFLPGSLVHYAGYLNAAITQQCIPCNSLKSPVLSPIITESGNALEIFNNIETDQLFRIYPNPTTGQFTIESRMSGSMPTIILQVFDFMGKKLTEEQIQGFSQGVFSISQFPDGIYNIRLIAGEHIQIQRIIKTR